MKCENCGYPLAYGINRCSNCGASIIYGKSALNTNPDGQRKSTNNETKADCDHTPLENYLMLAQRYENRQEFSEAVQYFRRAAELDSTNISALSGLDRLERKIPVQFSRRKQLTGLAVKFYLYLDNDNIGTLSPGDKQIVNLKPGVYNVKVHLLTSVVFNHDIVN